MDALLIAAYLTFSVLAIVQAALIAVQTWEHRRFARSRLNSLPRCRASGRVVLIVPCRGIDVGLERNLGTLLRQDYEDYEVRFVVESTDDPAYAVICRMAETYPEAAMGVIVAGRAATGGQKVHNLLAATAELPDDVKYLAFADSDARLRRQWLRAMVSRLDREEAGAVTGYRWFIPVNSSWANLLLYGINSSVAIFLGRHSPTVLWGGSWAIRRPLFDSLGIRRAWEGTLSDDLVVSRLLLNNGLRVAYEPACMVASPVDIRLGELFWFVRRQYLMARFYLPGWWTLALVLITYSNIVFWGSLVAVPWRLASGQEGAWLPSLVCTTLYLLHGFGGLFRQDTVGVYFPQLHGRLRKARRFEVWGGPLVALINGIEMIASVIGRRLTWRGITYRLEPGGRVTMLRRNDATSTLDDAADKVPSLENEDGTQQASICGRIGSDRGDALDRAA